MAEFQMKIAGAVARVRTRFASTESYFSRYLTAEAPEFTIAPTAEDLQFEQDFKHREAIEEGIRPRVYAEPHLERVAIQRQFAEFLLRRDTLLLHGSTVAADGGAYLFTAKCGTGKSTHTRLWCQILGQRARMVNDDKPFLQLGQGEVVAYGSPWNGKHGLSNPIAVPLRGICILRRGSENRIWSIEPREALPMLRSQVYTPLDPAQMGHLESLLHRLAETVPLWAMTCTPEIAAARVAFAAMAERDCKKNG